eukprot:gnl/TRDRNA2_/TRDRNA2_157888_c0_seq1.p1 gnl/TRDRNA2_/TRDRNA2_157888_c0~~gnl/TRDRNA2_/TRDRNA2_157888_c0_seq1.p1  ORF type:complete len:193 (+),score=14.05 gnl/TRDRNA2_/TRDRNA2_157888_c0_seq1:112-690(+)
MFSIVAINLIAVAAQAQIAPHLQRPSLYFSSPRQAIPLSIPRQYPPLTRAVVPPLPSSAVGGHSFRDRRDMVLRAGTAEILPGRYCDKRYLYSIVSYGKGENPVVKINGDECREIMIPNVVMGIFSGWRPGNCKEFGYKRYFGSEEKTILPFGKVPVAYFELQSNRFRFVVKEKWGGILPQSKQTRGNIPYK